MKESFYQIGKITKLHGYKGQLSAQLQVSDPTYYSKMESVFIRVDSNPIPFFISELSINGNKALFTFEDIKSETTARSFIGKELLVLEKHANPKDLDSVSFDSLVGYTIHDAASGNLGTVIDFLESANNELLVVEKEGKELLIPVRSNFITKAVRSTKTVHVQLPEGFVELYY